MRSIPVQFGIALFTTALCLCINWNAVVWPQNTPGENLQTEMTVDQILDEIQEKLDTKKDLEHKIRENLQLKKAYAEESKRLEGQKRVLKNKFSTHTIECTATYQQSQLNAYLEKRKWCDEDKAKLQDEQKQLNEKSRLLGEKELKRFQDAKMLVSQYEMNKAKLQTLQKLLTYKPWAQENPECLKKPSLESMHCCMSHLWDNKNPAECEKVLQPK